MELLSAGIFNISILSMALSIALILKIHESFPYVLSSSNAAE
jgi:hypothetical protein